MDMLEIILSLVVIGVVLGWIAVRALKDNIK
jgi:hypothetical protein